MATYLSKNFALEELIVSAGIVITPTEDQKKVLQKLVDIILQPIRDYVNAPVRINSCLRTKETNKKLLEAGYHASKTSDHLIPKKIITAEEFKKNYNNSVKNYLKDGNSVASGAADFTIPTYNIKKLFNLYVNLISILQNKYNQLIFYPNQSFIHVSLKRNLVYPFEFDSAKPLLIFDGENFNLVDYITLINYNKKKIVPYFKN